MTFWDFEGRWHLTRRITDRLSSRKGHLQGEATFTRRYQGLDYFETGQLAFDGGLAALTAERRYRWAPRDGGADIFFDDGRFFHTVLFLGRPTAHHDCAPDRYDVGYDFLAWPAWSATWEVTGPRKDYRMASRYSPLSN